MSSSSIRRRVACVRVKWSLAYGCRPRFEQERRLLVPLLARCEVRHGGLVVSGGEGERDEDGGRCVGSVCGQLLAGSAGESSGQTRIATLPRYHATGT